MGFATLNAILRAALLLFPAVATAAPRDCGTVIAEANNDITSFNPVLAENLGDSRAAQLLFQPLVWVNRHGIVDLSRSLASKIDVSADTMRYTITLRPWAWSDGVPVTAGDVVYDWRLIAELGQDYPGYGTGGIPQQIHTITAPDAAHVQIVLNAPANPLWIIDNGLSQLVALPEHAWSKLSLATLFQMQSEPGFFTVVDGPMRIDRLDVGLDAVFVPDPSYAGPKLHLTRLVLLFEHSDATALQQVEAGNLDFAPVPLEFYGAVRHLPGVRIELLSPVSFWYYLSLNLRNPGVAFFRDVRVREAMQDAIDQKAVIKLVYHGFGAEVYTPIPPVDANMLSPGLAAGNYPVGYDLPHARALLEAAGFSLGSGKIFQKDGKPLSFTALVTDDSAEDMEMVTMIQAQLSAAGIDMKLRQVDFTRMMHDTETEPLAWDAAEHGTVLNPYPSGEGLFATGAGENDGGYSDATMDRLIQASIAKPGISGLYDYEMYAARQQPVIFLATEDHIDLVAKRIHGVDGFSDGALLAPDALYCEGQ